MIPFQPVVMEDAPLLRRYYENCNYELYEYALGSKLMWRDFLQPHWAEVSGRLFVFVDYGEGISCEYPLRSGGGRGIPM